MRNDEDKTTKDGIVRRLQLKEVQPVNMQSSDLRSLYKAKRSTYEQFTNCIESLLQTLLQGNKIKYQLLDSRTKDVESFYEKACRPGKHYQSPLDEITDITGIRLIAYYLDDIDKMIDVIRQEFEIHEKDSLDKGSILGENEFGYRSVHFVVELSEKRVKLTEYSQYAGMKAEIQVRTVLQHAWAAASHALHYKAQGDVPSQLRRRLSRLSGLFELADEEFCAIRERHIEIADSYDSQLADGNTDIEIAQESLASYFNQNDYLEKFRQIAERNDCELVEFCHSTVMDDYSDLRIVCSLLNIESIRTLEQTFQDIEEQAESYLTQLFQNGYWSVSPIYILQLLLLVHCGQGLMPKTLELELAWDEYTASSVIKTSQSFAS